MAAPAYPTTTIPPTTLDEILRLTTLAPSGHNTQPWRIEVRGSHLTLFPDHRRRLPVADPDDHALYLSLGCAVENLMLAARARGLAAEVAPFPGDGDRIEVHLVHTDPPADAGLADWIPYRQVTRSRYARRPLPEGWAEQLTEMARAPGVGLHVVSDPVAIAELADLTAAAVHRQFSDPAFVTELLTWIRFTRAEARQSGDGLAAPALGLPLLPRAIGSALMRLGATPRAEARRAKAAVRASSAILIFTVARMDRRHWFALGRTFERVALAVTARGLMHAHVNAACEVPALRAELRRHLDATAGHPLLMVRVGWGRRRSRSPRRALAEVVSRPAPATPSDHGELTSAR